MDQGLENEITASSSEKEQSTHLSFAACIKQPVPPFPNFFPSPNVESRATYVFNVPSRCQRHSKAVVVGAFKVGSGRWTLDSEAPGGGARIDLRSCSSPFRWSSQLSTYLEAEFVVSGGARIDQDYEGTTSVL